MKAAIIAIGNELLSGKSEDTNSRYLIRQLQTVGIPTESVQIARDDVQSIISVLNNVSEDHDIVLVTGGLGPTHDDLTVEAVAKYLDSALVHSDIVTKRIEKLFTKLGVKAPSKSIAQQSQVPEKAELIPNLHGTAQGLKFVRNHHTFYVMPGVPREMQNMFDHFILPELGKKSTRKILTRTIHSTGLPESTLYGKIERWIKDNPDVNVSILPHFPEVRINLSTHHPDSEPIIDSAVEKLNELLGPAAYGVDSESLVSVIADYLVKYQLTIATVESCTGGLIASRLTDVPGSSAYFMQGFITYSNRSKLEILNIAEETLRKHGAVSREVAREMAHNVRKLAGTDIGLSITGIAGPGGGSDQKPVGTVYIGLSTDKNHEIFHFRYNRDRLSNKLFFSQMALNQLRLHLKETYE